MSCIGTAAAFTLVFVNKQCTHIEMDIISSTVWMGQLKGCCSLLAGVERDKNISAYDRRKNEDKVYCMNILPIIECCGFFGAQVNAHFWDK